ncbi:MAG: hypothetical protein FWG31_09470 [Oscillospiraceae bacterium]|nr:hypothetical protein [Oscillospiraceae bacterium]
MDELLELIENAQDPEGIANAIAEHQQTMLESIQGAIPIMIIAVGVIIGLLGVMVFSSAMKDAS